VLAMICEPGCSIVACCATAKFMIIMMVVQQWRMYLCLARAW
jgi:hypothetical protein